MLDVDSCWNFALVDLVCPYYYDLLTTFCLQTFCKIDLYQYKLRACSNDNYYYHFHVCLLAILVHVGLVWKR
jgi:hypothetical protein